MQSCHRCAQAPVARKNVQVSAACGAWHQTPPQANVWPKLHRHSVSLPTILELSLSLDFHKLLLVVGQLSRGSVLSETEPQARQEVLEYILYQLNLLRHRGGEHSSASGASVPLQQRE